MNGLRWRVPDGASWESLLGGLRLALIALCHSLKKQGKVDRDKGRGQIVAALQPFTG